MSTPRTSEPEFTAPRALCDSRGRLEQDAIGWSRHPLHVCAIPGHRGRKKRWNYWAVQTDRVFFALTLADVDYLGLATASLLDLRTRTLVERVVATPLGRGLALPDTTEGGAIRFDALGLHIGMVDDPEGTRLTARFVTLAGDALDAEVLVRRPAAHESVNVVIPWSARRFQFTSKQTALPAEGHARVNGTLYTFDDDAFACLDFGRGVWPYRTTWNWAVAAGTSGGRTIGVNLGGQWTRDTGMTENGVTIDGRVHKIGEEVSFAFEHADLDRPWRVRDVGARRVDLVFTPEHTRRVRVRALAIGSELDHAIGSLSGEIALDDGERIAVRDLRGWAEEHRARW